jgi:uncharacterized protein YkwD
MKKILTIIILLLSILGFSQTKLDSLVFTKVNQYRIEKGLKEVKFDTATFKAAKHHTSYLYRKNLDIWPNSISGHTEDTLVDFTNRYEFYAPKKRYLHIAEVALSISKNYKVDDTTILEKMSTEIIEGWKSSPKHNKILLTGDFVFAGVNCQYFSNPTGIKSSLNYRIVGTMLFVR